MIGLLALLLRIVILAVFTFGFVVLFEHGTKNYLDHAKSDAIMLQDWAEAKLGTRLTPSAPLAPPSSEVTAQPSSASGDPIPSAPVAAPETTPASPSAAAPAATPLSTPIATSPAPVATAATPAPGAVVPGNSEEPTAAPSDWQSLQNKPINDESAPPSQ